MVLVRGRKLIPEGMLLLVLWLVLLLLRGDLRVRGEHPVALVPAGLRVDHH
jgi:hypothetical protein